MGHLKLTDMCDKNAFDIIKRAVGEGLNIIITGGNDTGKSAFLRAIIAKVNIHNNLWMSRADIIDLTRQMYPHRNIAELRGILKDAKDGSNATYILDNVNEDYILNVIKKSIGQVILVDSKMSYRLTKTIAIKKGTAIVIKMGRLDGVAYVTEVSEIGSDGKSYKLYSR